MKQMSTAITPAPVPSPRRRPSATTSTPMTTMRIAPGIASARPGASPSVINVAA